MNLQDSQNLWAMPDVQNVDTADISTRIIVQRKLVNNMNYNDYYDEIYLDIYEEFGETAVSDVSYAKELQSKKVGK